MTPCGLGWPYQIESLGVCGGHGVCAPEAAYNNRSVCQCDDGWMSAGTDFQASTDVLDCSISTWTVRALWALNIVVSLVFVTMAMPSMRHIVARHFRLAAEARAKGRRYGLRRNKGLRAIMPWLVVGLPAQLALGVLKLAGPVTWHIGKDWAPTLLWWASRTAFYYAIFTFQPFLVESLLHHMTAGSRRAHQVAGVLFFCTVSSQFVVLWPMLVNVDVFLPLPGMIAAAVYFLLFALCFLLMAAQTVFIKQSIIRVLDESLLLKHDQRTLATKNNLVHAQNKFLSQLVLQGVLYLFFAAWPFMWSKRASPA